MKKLVAALMGALIAGTATSAAAVETLHVESSGRTPEIVLIPGLSGCAYGFREVVADLDAAGVGWAIIEPLAVGASPRPEGADYSLTAQADRVAAAIVGLGGRPVVVVGHGISGSIALRVALRHPQLVRAVVSIEGAASENAATATVDRSLRWAGLAVKLGGGRLLRDRFEADLAAASGDRSWITGLVVRRYFAHANRDLPAAIAALRAMARAVEPQALGANLPLIDCPVLLLVGGAEHDGSLSAADITTLQDGLPRCEVQEVPGAGHFIFEEQPSVVVQVLTRMAATSVTVAPDQRSVSCAQ